MDYKLNTHSMLIAWAMWRKWPSSAVMCARTPTIIIRKFRWNWNEIFIPFVLPLGAHRTIFYRALFLRAASSFAASCNTLYCACYKLTPLRHTMARPIPFSPGASGHRKEQPPKPNLNYCDSLNTIKQKDDNGKSFFSSIHRHLQSFDVYEAIGYNASVAFVKCVSCSWHYIHCDCKSVRVAWSNGSL